MSESVINGIPVKFPFQPYDLQKDYMSKVITCLDNEQNGVLESPTGTGKTLALLCSSLAWLERKKAQMQLELQTRTSNLSESDINWLQQIGGQKSSSNTRNAFVQWPQIIYASRTHSQLSQAMKELKRTAYKYMQACVLGSREQMCVHPQIRELQDNAEKVQQCRVKVQTRSCFYHNHVQRETSNPVLSDNPVVDIEDLVKFGDTFKFCPYYMARELRQSADIVFMPYNYLLDPRTRKALGVELSNAVIILDEAHNVEKICEESASMQIKSTDITLCIDEVTEVMKAISDENNELNFSDSPPDFSPEELIVLKQIFLKFEQALDGVVIPKNGEGLTNDGSYVFRLLADAGVTDTNQERVASLIDRICTFMATVNTGPFQRKGRGLQQFEDLLRIVFTNAEDAFKEKLKHCYKVHIDVDKEGVKKGASKKGTRLSNATAGAQTECRILSFWCFSPGFGMNMLMAQGVKCVILTSGTLAPLKPLITELEMTVDVRLENPHIVKSNQVCVKILSKGPDGTLLNSSYQNRNNPDYVKSLGMTISNLARAIPDGLLVFFPSYSVMLQCQTAWEQGGLWDAICKVKQIFVEPRTKDAFAEAMKSYYGTINTPGSGGAIFMGVCRGKVSEGLDFIDANGRAVVITGLPYPPLKDPRVILKRRYLDVCHARNRDYLNGNDWYSLEATKAVNQAIGRVIRHGKDYGSIILLDSRFNNAKVINQMSLWLRDHVKSVNTYGELIRELRGFYRDAASKFPVTEANAVSFPDAKIYQNSQSCINEVQIHKRRGENMEPTFKRQKFVLKASASTSPEREKPSVDDIKEYLKLMRRNLTAGNYQKLIGAIRLYMSNFLVADIVNTLKAMCDENASLSQLFLGISNFLRDEDKSEYDAFLAKYQT